MMEADAQSVTEWPRPLAWFREFLKDELSPYPGRLALVARMVLAATAVMVIFMTFRIPYSLRQASVKRQILHRIFSLFVRSVARTVA